MPENELVTHIRTVCAAERINVREAPSKQYHDLRLTPIGRMWRPKHMGDYDLDARRLIWPRKDDWCEQCARQVFEKYMAIGLMARPTNADGLRPEEEDF